MFFVILARDQINSLKISHIRPRPTPITGTKSPDLEVILVY